MDVANISDLFGVTPSRIAEASNLGSGINQLFPGQLLLVPINCGCTGSRYFANITYQIKSGDTYYLVSLDSLENLTRWQEVQEFNPSLDPKLLQIGTNLTFPLFCKCPTVTQMENSISKLITYVWQQTDDVLRVSETFNASSADIEAENGYQNYNDAVGLPVLIPVKQLPALSQSYPPQQAAERNHPKHRRILIIIVSLFGSLLVVLSIVFWLSVRRLHERKKTMNRLGSSLETSGLVQMKEKATAGDFGHGSTTSKLLPGLSGYLGKPIVYDTRTIMEATMNLNEHCRIGGSVYRATVNGLVLAVKKTKEDVTEELKILQKVNHANLVSLIGISSDNDGNCFLVYEYAENGSLDQWLHSKSANSLKALPILTWSQRLNIALDVANGLYYLHEHTQPTIVHGDIRAGNILLDRGMKAKIANFCMARSATNCLMPKDDVFAFGVVLLELISGKKAMETKENGEVVMLWRGIRWVLEVEDSREKRLKKWMDPNLRDLYPMDGAISLAALARACTEEKAVARPTMGEVVFSISVIVQSSSEASQESWASAVHGEEEKEEIPIGTPVTAR